MQTESPVPGRVLEWFQGPASREERSAIPERIAGEAKAGTPPLELLRGMQLFSARLGGPGDLMALLAVDAIWDFLPIWEGEEDRLLRSGAAFLCHGAARELHPEWLERAPLLEGPVYGRSLDLVLDAPTLEEAGSRIARMLSVIQTEEYFQELLLEAAARDWKAPGWNLSFTNAGVRAMIGRAWREQRDVLFRVVEALHSSSLARFMAPVRGEVAPLPIARCFLLAAREARDLTGACQVLAHAFQAERACRLKQREVRSSIHRSLRAWFPGLESSPEGWRPRPLDAASAEPADPDPLFRPISEACLPALEEGDPRPLLLANGARWGAHLLQGDRMELIERVEREVAS